MRSFFSLLAPLVVAVCLLPLSARAQSASSSLSAPVTRTLSFAAASPTSPVTVSILLPVSAQQILNITSFTTNPPGYESALRATMKVYNAAGQVIQSGQGSQIYGGVDDYSTPATVTFTSPQALTLGTRTVTQKGLYNRGSSDPTKAPVLRGDAFTLSGHFVGGGSVISGRSNNSITLTSGEQITLTSLKAVCSTSQLTVSIFSPSNVENRFVDSYTNSSTPPRNISYRALSTGTYILCVSTSVINTPGFIFSTGYSVNFQTSFAPQAPGRGAHSMQPETPVKSIPIVGAAPPGHSGCGPSCGDPVDLASGQESYDPSADLPVYNPSGPDVAFSRHYSTERANAFANSPGLPMGWYSQSSVGGYRKAASTLSWKQG